MRLFAVFALLGGAAFGGAAGSQSAEAVKRAIQKIYDQQSACWKKMDAKALEAHYRSRATPDFVSTADGTKRTLAVLIANIEPILKSTQKVHEYSIRVQKVEVKGKSATVDTTGRIVMDVLDAAQRAHRVVIEQMGVSAWVRDRQGWKVKSTKVTTTRLSVNGREAPGIGG